MDGVGGNAGTSGAQDRAKEAEFKDWVSDRLVSFVSGFNDKMSPLLGREPPANKTSMANREPYKLEPSSAEPVPVRGPPGAEATPPEADKGASAAVVEKVNLSAHNIHCDLTEVEDVGPDTKILLLHLNPGLTGAIDLLDRCGKLQVVCLAETSVRGNIEVFAACPVLMEVNLWSCGAVKGDVEVFQHCPYLARCWLGYTAVSGDLRSLGACTRLQKLDLFETKVTGSLEALLPCAKLSFLWLRKTEVYGRIEVLARLTKLETVDLRFTGVIGKAEVLRQALPNCTIKVLSATTMSEFRLRSARGRSSRDGLKDVSSRFLSVEPERRGSLNITRRPAAAAGRSKSTPYQGVTPLARQRTDSGNSDTSWSSHEGESEGGAVLGQPQQHLQQQAVEEEEDEIAL